MSSVLDAEYAEYNVTFIGDHFSMMVTVEVVEGDEDAAIDAASNLIKDHYGFDVIQVSNDIYVIGA